MSSVMRMASVEDDITPVHLTARGNPACVVLIGNALQSFTLHQLLKITQAQ